MISWICSQPLTSLLEDRKTIHFPTTICSTFQPIIKTQYTWSSMSCKRDGSISVSSSSTKIEYHSPAINLKSQPMRKGKIWGMIQMANDSWRWSLFWWKIILQAEAQLGLRHSTTLRDSMSTKSTIFTATTEAMPVSKTSCPALTTWG